MKASIHQFAIISRVLDKGLERIEAGGNTLQGYLAECEPFATKCRDTYALWLLLKIGRAHLYKDNSWRFNEELEETGDKLNDEHILTAMKAWLKDKLAFQGEPLTFNSYEAVKQGITTEEQARFGLEGFLNVIADALETRDQGLTVSLAGFGKSSLLMHHIITMPPAGSISMPVDCKHFSITVGDSISLTILNDMGEPLYSMPLILNLGGMQLTMALAYPVNLPHALGRRAFRVAEWTPYGAERA